MKLFNIKQKIFETLRKVKYSSPPPQPPLKYNSLHSTKPRKTKHHPHPSNKTNKPTKQPTQTLDDSKSQFPPDC